MERDNNNGVLWCGWVDDLLMNIMRKQVVEICKSQKVDPAFQNEKQTKSWMRNSQMGNNNGQKGCQLSQHFLIVSILLPPPFHHNRYAPNLIGLQAWVRTLIGMHLNYKIKPILIIIIII